MRMSGQKIYRGRVRASLPASHKPYQTLEVAGDAGVVAAQPNSHYQLVDPGIQLHQQEYVLY